jgi:hypothetical protein
MGVLYYALNHDSKEVIFLNKWFDLMDTDENGDHRLNLKPETESECDGYPHEKWWRTFIHKLRWFQTQQIVSDSNCDISDQYPDYTIVGSRFESDSKYFGLTVNQQYDRISK